MLSSKCITAVVILGLSVRSWLMHSLCYEKSSLPDVKAVRVYTICARSTKLKELSINDNNYYVYQTNRTVKNYYP